MHPRGWWSTSAPAPWWSAPTSRLEVEISESQDVSQPEALASEAGRTVVVPKTQIKVKEKEGSLHLVRGAATVADVAAALNSLGVKPRDLVAILQALKAAGALTAEIQLL
jgi:flagellar P-ring protein precursor FlgI